MVRVGVFLLVVLYITDTYIPTNLHVDKKLSHPQIHEKKSDFNLIFYSMLYDNFIQSLRDNIKFIYIVISNLFFLIVLWYAERIFAKNFVY